MKERAPIAYFLMNSEYRPEILRSLRERPRRVCELAEQIDLRRRNVQRNLSLMSEKDLVTKRDGRYELTVYGYYVEEHYRTFLAEMASCRRTRSASIYLTLEDPLSRVVIDTRTEFESIVENIPEALQLIEQHVTESDSVTCVIPTIDAPFAVHLLQLLSGCRSVQLIVDECISSRTFTSLLTPYDFDPDVRYEKTLNHFLIRSGSDSFVGIVDDTSVQCVTHSTCTDFAAAIDEVLSPA